MLGSLRQRWHHPHHHLCYFIIFLISEQQQEILSSDFRHWNVRMLLKLTWKWRWWIPCQWRHLLIKPRPLHSADSFSDLFFFVCLFLSGLIIFPPHSSSSTNQLSACDWCHMWRRLQSAWSKSNQFPLELKLFNQVIDSYYWFGQKQTVNHQ